jgi:hypothetical protein
MSWQFSQVNFNPVAGMRPLKMLNADLDRLKKGPTAFTKT